MTHSYKIERDLDGLWLTHGPIPCREYICPARARRSQLYYRVRAKLDALYLLPSDLHPKTIRELVAALRQEVISWHCES